MLCFRCGSYNKDDAQGCSVCGQRFDTDKKPKTKKSESSKSPGLFEVGDVVSSRYEIRSLISQGSVGNVYKAFDREAKTDVALKAISPNLLQTEEERRLFSKQIQRARKLHHPNIVRIYDEGHDDNRRWFTMTLLEGLTLRRVLRLRHDKGQAFSTEELVPIAHQVAAALDYAHKSTWHGGIKPENIIILPDLLKITDFNLVKGLPLKPFLGIAKTKSRGYDYIAPEVRMESSQIDKRCDIYSMGVVICEMLTGLVFDGHYTKEMKSALGQLPAKVDGLLRRVLAEHPDGRFETASEFAAELEVALEEVKNGLPKPTSSSTSNVVKKTPPPAPLETSPSKDTSLEELNPSAVVLLGDHQERPEDIGYAPPPVDEADTEVESHAPIASEASASKRAEGIVEALYDDADNMSRLAPPPLPFDAGFQTDLPGKVAEDLSEEPTNSDMLGLGIHEELTALKGQRRAPPTLVPIDDEEEPTATVKHSLGPESLNHEQLAAASRRSSPRLNDAERVPAVVAAAVVSPASRLKPVSPVRPTKNNNTMIYVAAGVAAFFIMVIGIWWAASSSDDDKKVPVVLSGVDAGPVVAIDDIPSVGGVDAALLTKPDAGVDPTVIAAQQAEADRLAQLALADEAKRLEDEKLAAAKLIEDEKKRVADEKARQAAMDAALNSVDNDSDAKKLADKKAAEEAKKLADKKAAEDAKKLADKKAAEDAKKDAAAKDVAMVAKTCPKGMVKISGGTFLFGAKASDPMRNYGEKLAKSTDVAPFCIDYYEFPNSKKATPKTRVTWSSAAAFCKRRGKRLCAEKEWEFACKSKSNRRFPYGNAYRNGNCNTQDENGNKGELAPAREFPKCRSKYNVIAMSGNAEEWTSDSFKGGSSKTVKGGAADRPDWASRCSARRGLSPGSKKATLGFRCCADVQ